MVLTRSVYPRGKPVQRNLTRTKGRTYWLLLNIVLEEVHIIVIVVHHLHVEIWGYSLASERNARSTLTDDSCGSIWSTTAVVETLVSRMVQAEFGSCLEEKFGMNEWHSVTSSGYLYEPQVDLYYVSNVFLSLIPLKSSNRPIAIESLCLRSAVSDELFSETNR